MEHFWDFWQHLPEKIDPVFFRLGALQIRWYGVMFLSAFVFCFLFLTWRVKKEGAAYTPLTLNNFFGWVLVAGMIGGRLGYVLFYDWAYFSQHPLQIFLPFDPLDDFRFTGIAGMSYHGGLVAVLVVSFLFCRKHKIEFWSGSDFVMPCVPLGYMFGRIGNFLNLELYGRPTDASWGMYFPTDAAKLLRHPSQLYEAFFEGIVLFVFLWLIRNKDMFKKRILATYLMAYGGVRFFIEFYREPDAHLGLVLGSLSLGQLLCIGMILAGALLFSLKRSHLIR